MSSAEMADMVRSGREFARDRERRHPRQELVTKSFSEEARRAFETCASRLAMGGRSINRAARVARTIADINHHDEVQVEDIMEAISYRGRSIG